MPPHRSLCQQLLADGEFSHYIKEHTGLLIDAYFSATKLKWILDTWRGPGRRPRQGSSSSAPWTPAVVRLTGGKVHVTDYTNASRTMLL